MDSVEPLHVTDDDILNRLRETVEVAVGKNRANVQTVEQIMNKLKDLKAKFQTLSQSEKSKFIQQMQGSFEDTIATIENKLAKQARNEQMFNCSVLILAVVLVVFALFGYKLYKSLMEKERKKQEKQKNQKKSKKSKQK